MNDRPFEENLNITREKKLVRDGVQYPRIFAIHSRIKPFYSRNLTFVTQEITNTLLKKFEGP